MTGNVYPTEQLPATLSRREFGGSLIVLALSGCAAPPASSPKPQPNPTTSPEQPQATITSEATSSSPELARTTALAGTIAHATARSLQMVAGTRASRLVTEPDSPGGYNNSDQAIVIGNRLDIVDGDFDPATTPGFYGYSELYGSGRGLVSLAAGDQADNYALRTSFVLSIGNDLRGVANDPAGQPTVEDFITGYGQPTLDIAGGLQLDSITWRHAHDGVSDSGSILAGPDNSLTTSRQSGETTAIAELEAIESVLSAIQQAIR